MRNTRLLREWTALKALLLALTVAALVGCSGSDIDDDDGYDPGYRNYPQYKNLTIVLRVVDPQGNPIGGASVWVADHEDDTTTDRRLHPLAEGYPRKWQGWLANWASDDYRVVINYPGDRDEFTIEAGRAGYWSAQTRVSIADYEPDEIFVRDVLVLPAKSTIYSAQTTEAGEAEAVAADENFERAPGHEPQITIGEE